MTLLQEKRTCLSFFAGLLAKAKCFHWFGALLWTLFNLSLIIATTYSFTMHGALSEWTAVVIMNFVVIEVKSIGLLLIPTMILKLKGLATSKYLQIYSGKGMLTFVAIITIEAVYIVMFLKQGLAISHDFISALPLIWNAWSLIAETSVFILLGGVVGCLQEKLDRVQRSGQVNLKTCKQLMEEFKKVKACTGMALLVIFFLDTVTIIFTTYLSISLLTICVHSFMHEYFTIFGVFSVLFQLRISYLVFITDDCHKSFCKLSKSIR